MRAWGTVGSGKTIYKTERLDSNGESKKQKNKSYFKNTGRQNINGFKALENNA